MQCFEVGSSASPGGKIKGCKDMWRSVEAQHGGARGRGGAGTRGRVGCQSTTSSSPTSWGRSTPSCSLVTGANQQPAAHQLAGGGRHHLGVLSQVPLRQNRQWALPVSRRGGGERRPDCPKEEKPRWGQDFLNSGIFVNLCPHFHFSWGQRYLVCCMLESLSFL